MYIYTPFLLFIYLFLFLILILILSCFLFIYFIYFILFYFILCYFILFFTSLYLILFYFYFNFNFHFTFIFTPFCFSALKKIWKIYIKYKKKINNKESHLTWLCHAKYGQSCWGGVLDSRGRRLGIGVSVAATWEGSLSIAVQPWLKPTPHTSKRERFISLDISYRWALQKKKNHGETWSH